MKLVAVELRRISVPYRGAFRTSHGTESAKEAVLVRVITPDSEGWGECVAADVPSYSSEYADAALDVLRQHLVPVALAANSTAAQLGPDLAGIQGHRMAKAALEMALLDAELKAVGMSLAGYLGATREFVPAGVSVGIPESMDDLVREVDGYLTQGYVRIKLKIEPGWDIEPVRTIRERFGPDIPLQVDANTAYHLSDARHLARLDDFDLLLIEQPLPEDDVAGHAQLAKELRTPICLDESITSARVAAAAISVGACRIINVKAGRVGGYLEARRVAAVAAAHGIPVWCGGMLETGIGRAANIALAACPEFTIVGDISASNRFYERDLTEPFVLDNGRVAVPEGPGLGINIDDDALQEATTAVEIVRPT